MRIDLHCHSKCSDGADPPEQVARLATEAGVELFCLTDHDTCDGYGETVGCSPNVLRGLELSCAENGRTVHLLLYDCARDDTRWGHLEERLRDLREARKDRLRAIASRLARLGLHVDVGKIIARAGTRTVGRPDIAQALVDMGAVSSVREAFNRFLADNGKAFVPLARLTMLDGLRLGREAGARISLAHPHTLGPRVDELVATHRWHGLEGLECYYGSYGQRQRRRWLALAKRHDMVVTGGSDYHGADRGPQAQIGIELPAEHADRLTEWLAA